MSTVLSDRGEAQTFTLTVPSRSTSRSADPACSCVVVCRTHVFSSVALASSRAAAGNAQRGTPWFSTAAIRDRGKFRPWLVGTTSHCAGILPVMLRLHHCESTDYSIDRFLFCARAASRRSKYFLFCLCGGKSLQTEQSSQESPRVYICCDIPMDCSSLPHAYDHWARKCLRGRFGAGTLDVEIARPLSTISPSPPTPYRPFEEKQNFSGRFGAGTLHGETA